MKQTFTASAILSILAAACLLWLGSGCASVGNGKLDGPVVDAVNSVDKVAIIEAAAAGASGDYAKALSKIGKAVQKKQKAIADLDAAMKDAGFAFARAMYFDGTLIQDETRFSKREWWEKVTVGDAALPSTPSATTELSSEDDALASEIADILSDLSAKE